MSKLEWCDHSRARRAPIASALLSLSVVSGCSSGVPIEADISARPSTVLQLSWAKAMRTTRGIVVSGQIQQVHCCRSVRGHIHVEAMGQNGASIASTNTLWGEFNPRQLHSAWFKAVLPVPPERRIAVIDIQFITDPDK